MINVSIIRIPSRLIAVCFALLVAALYVSTAQAAEAEKTNNTFAEWKGAEYPWPETKPIPLSTSVKWESTPEDPQHQVFRVSGEGLSIAARNITPFIMDDTVSQDATWAGSATLYDSHSKSGALHFTHFAKGNFMPEVDMDSLTGYAKALIMRNNPEKGVLVEIVVPPSELSRKAALLRSKPLFITWKLSDRITGANFQRTDYFWMLDDGSLLVASIVALPEEEPGVRAAACNVLRFAQIEDNAHDSAK